MKRNFGLPDKDGVDPKVKRFFPWALFLACALAFGIAAHYMEKPTIDDFVCYGHDQYQAMWDGKPPCKGASVIDKARDLFGIHRVWKEEGDPYACFGAGRYDAMRDGRVCPGFEGK
jgi:hypothetical protein